MLARAQRPQHIETAVRGAAEDDQIDVAGPAALPQRAGVARAMDPVSVEFKLAGQRSICSLLADTSSTPGHRLENPAGRWDSLGIAGQSLPPRTVVWTARQSRAELVTDLKGQPGGVVDRAGR